MKELKSSAPPLGTFEGIEYKTTCISYEKGTRILLYTDGVSESLPDDYLKFFLKETPFKEIADLKANLVERLNDETNTKKDDQCFILIDLK